MVSLLVIAVLVLAACETGMGNEAVVQVGEEPAADEGAIGAGGAADIGAATDTDSVTGADEMAVQGGVGISSAPAAQVSASSLMDYNFNDLTGEDTGNIEDVIIDTASGRILYLVVEHGGLLDIGATEVVAPLGAVTWGEDNNLTLNVQEDQLGTFPQVGDDWPNASEPTWDDELGNFWTELGFGSDEGNYQEATTTVVRALSLIGRPVQDLGSGEGNVEDILLDVALQARDRS